jgi:hypothetical protein
MSCLVRNAVTAVTSANVGRAVTLTALKQLAVWDYGEGMEMLRVFWDEAVALNPAADVTPTLTSTPGTSCG